MSEKLKILFYSLLYFFAVATISIPFFIYRNHFNGSFAEVSSEWSNFGGYYGGIVGPILSFLSVLLLILTVAIQERALFHQKNEVDKSLEIIKKNNKYLEEQIANTKKQKFEETFSASLQQRFMLFETYKTGNKEGSQIFRDDIDQLLRDCYEKYIEQKTNLQIGGPKILRYIGLYNYLISIATNIQKNIHSEDDTNYYFELLRYSLIETELTMLIIFKEKTESKQEIISKILGEYDSITLLDLVKAGSLGLFGVASQQGIRKIEF